MKTNVTQTSLDAHDGLKAHIMADSQKLIVAAMQPGKLYSRKHVARLTKLETSSVSGRVFELIEDGIIEVCGTMKCPVTGKKVEAIRLVSQQSSLFN